MPVSLLQVSRTGSAPSTKANVAPGATAVPAYDATVSDKDHTIGGAAIELDETTTLIGIRDVDNATGFRWGIVATSDAALPANSPRWLPGDGVDFWETRPVPGVARHFKTAALA